jgi:hypothetical protein
MTCTLLSLDEFRMQIGHSPWHFWQLADAKYAPIVNSCNDLLRQYSYQSAGSAGRQDILTAIAQAEQKLFDYLKFSIAPHYVSADLDIGCLQHKAVGNGVGGNYANWAAGYIKLPEGRVTRIATETPTVLDDIHAVVYSDSDGDGLEDTFTLTLADTATDPTTIEIYFSSGDRLVGTVDDLCRWQIRPVVVKRTNATTIVITGAKWLCVKPIKYEGFGMAPGYNNDQYGKLSTDGALDTILPANFVTTLAVYTRVASATNNATLFYNDGCGVETSYTVCVTAVDRKTGMVAMLPQGGNCPCTCGYAFWSPYLFPTSGFALAGYPQQTVRLQINYRAGEPLPEWQTTVTRFALAELRKRICPCDEANEEIFRWQQDLARDGGVMEAQYRISNDDLENPLGTRAGAIDAWHRISRRGMLRGVNW